MTQAETALNEYIAGLEAQLKRADVKYVWAEDSAEIVCKCGNEIILSDGEKVACDCGKVYQYVTYTREANA